MENNDKKIKIAVIDDEKDIANTIRQLLEPRDYDVVLAYDGLSGLEMIKRESPDVVILDITMPQMDGRDVMIELKKDDETKNIPVIFLTARDEIFEKEYGKELGAHDYVTKPYDAQFLLDKIKSVLNTKN